MRPKQLHTLMGKVTIRRAYSQCMVKEEEPSASCSHGQAPFDQVWGLVTGRTSPGVHKLLGKLVARMTLAEAVETFGSLLPLCLSERQALNVIQPVGEALRAQEDEQVQALFEQATHKETHLSEHPAILGVPLRRLSSDLSLAQINGHMSASQQLAQGME